MGEIMKKFVKQAILLLAISFASGYLNSGIFDLDQDKVRRITKCVKENKLAELEKEINTINVEELEKYLVLRDFFCIEDGSTRTIGNIVALAAIRGKKDALKILLKKLDPETVEKYVTKWDEKNIGIAEYNEETREYGTLSKFAFHTILTSFKKNTEFKEAFEEIESILNNKSNYRKSNLIKDIKNQIHINDNLPSFNKRPVSNTIYKFEDCTVFTEK